MFKEFKEFALKGSLVDMATGIILGAAIGTVVTSLVNDIIMPPIGVLLGGVDFANIFTVLKSGDGGQDAFATVESAASAGAVTINWGLFINSLISFLIVAFVVFMLIKGVNNARRAEEDAPEDPPAQEVLLGEIRDLLKKQSG